MSSIHPISYVHIHFSTNTTLSFTILPIRAPFVNPWTLRLPTHHWEQVVNSPDRLQRLEVWAGSFPLLCIWTLLNLEPLLGSGSCNYSSWVTSLRIPASWFPVLLSLWLHSGRWSYSCFPVLVLGFCPISGFEVGSVIASDTQHRI